MKVSKITARSARQLIERMRLHPDLFGINHWAAARIPTWIISEAWTPVRRAEIRRQAGGLGYAEVDSIVINDYDMVLWHSNHAQEHGLPSSYIVSLNNAQHNPVDLDTQVGRHMRASDRLPVVEIRRKLIEWVDRYGGLIIGSVVQKRNAKYWRMVRHLLPEYAAEPFYKGDPKYGFLLRKIS